MKLLQHPDRDSFRESKRIQLDEDIEITVYSIPILFEADFTSDLPAKANMTEDEDNDYNLLHGAAMIAACVDPSEVAFSSRRDAHENVVDYYRSILREINGLLSVPLMTELCQAIADLTKPTEEEVETAEQDFFGEDRQGKPPAGTGEIPPDETEEPITG